MEDVFAADGNGQTALTVEERRGCKLSWITTRGELNEAEYENILNATVWSARQRNRLDLSDLLDDEFARKLHKRMYGDVWTWAGKYRTSEKNIGVHPSQIAVGVGQALDDARYWFEHATFPIDEIVLRTSHRLVAVHPFANGNGRWSRLYADILAEMTGGQPFSWGAGLLQGAAAIGAKQHKDRYIASLMAADNHSMDALIAFARA